jgi:hypothetical protein
MSHTDWCPQSRSSLRCLVTSSNSRLPLFPSSRSRRLATISHQPPTFLTAVSRLARNGSWSSLHSLGMDRRESTSCSSSSVVTCVSVSEITRRLLSHCLATDLFAEPFPSNDCLCWLPVDTPQYIFTPRRVIALVQIQGFLVYVTSLLRIIYLFVTYPLGPLSSESCITLFSWTQDDLKRRWRGPREGYGLLFHFVYPLLDSDSFTV